MKQYQSKHTAALSTRGFYTILSLCALIIAASAWVIWGNAHQKGGRLRIVPNRRMWYTK